MQPDVRPAVRTPTPRQSRRPGAAGVEEIMGFRFVRRGMFRGSGADALLGSRIATPGFCLARFDARRACGPAVCRRDGVAVRGGLRTG